MEQSGERTTRFVGHSLVVANWRTFARVAAGFILLCALGIGAGFAAMVPWLARTSVWSSQRAEALAESMLDEAARCSAQMMVAEKTCPLAFRVKSAAAAKPQNRNVGGE